MNYKNKKGFAHPILLVFLLVLLIVGVLFYQQQHSSQKLSEQNVAVKGTWSGPVQHDPRLCNAFNIRNSDGSYPLLTFDQSLTRVLATLKRDASLPTSVLVNRYGPWCDNETRSSGPIPFANNLINYIDTHARRDSDIWVVLGRVRKTTSTSSPRRCSIPDPPVNPRPGDVGVSCSAFSSHAAPGDPYFDYYRGALNSNKCTLNTHAWPDTEATSMENVREIFRKTYYNGNKITDTSIYDRYIIRQQQMEHILQRAKAENVNPLLVMGLWATESGFSNRPSCYGALPVNSLTIRASGTQESGVYPLMRIKVNGSTVYETYVTGSMADYYIPSVQAAAPGSVEVHFINDSGARNLQVDYIKLGGTIYQTEANTTYARGVWTSQYGCSSWGYFSTEWLACNGYFRY